MMAKLLSLLLFMSMPIFALDMQIKINQEQIANLGIPVGALTPSQHIPLLTAPAKVVIPGNHERLVNSAQPGLIVQLLANIGDHVKKDQVLAKINSPELVGLQREFLTASSEMDLSELEFQRDKKLLQEGVIADRRWQESLTLHKGKSAQLDTMRQLLAMAGMSVREINDLAKLRQLNSSLSIRAPIDGVVLERFVTLGARLDMQAPLYRIADLSELWLEINIPQERSSMIKLGDQVRVENTEVNAKISLLGQSVNHENQTVLARALLDDKLATLKAGQNLNVQIMRYSQQTAFLVNNSAIAQNAGHNYIFVRNQQGFAVTEVNIIGKQAADSLVTAPLTGQEQIALKGAVALKANWLGLGSE